MMKMAAIVVASTLAVASSSCSQLPTCQTFDPGPPRRLVDLKNVTLRLYILTGDGALQAQLFFEDAHSCRLEPAKVRASINGEELRERYFGGAACWEGMPACAFPSFGGVQTSQIQDLEFGQRGRIDSLEVTDENRSIAMSVVGAMVRRSVRIGKPTDGLLRAGDDVELTWSHPADSFGWARASFAYADGGVSDLLEQTQPSWADGGFHFKVPSVTRTGPGQIVFEASCFPHVDTCSGASTCQAEVELGRLRVPGLMIVDADGGM